MRKISPIKLEIVKRGLVQGDIAHDAGITESRLSRILNGREKPRDFELRNLARALGMKEEDFY